MANAVGFNADEIFEIAEQMERNGARFYRRAAGCASAGEARGLLLRLAEMEVQHERTFAAMREDLRLEAPGWVARFFDVEGRRETALYLRAIADGRVFDLRTDPAAALTGKEGLAEILRTAIDLEKDSVIFYLGVQEAVPEHLGRDKIDAIIHEEMGHITILTRELVGLGK